MKVLHAGRRSSPEPAVELLLGKISRRLAQDLVGLPKLAAITARRTGSSSSRQTLRGAVDLEVLGEDALDLRPQGQSRFVRTDSFSGSDRWATWSW